MNGVELGMKGQPELATLVEEAGEPLDAVGAIDSLPLIGGYVQDPSKVFEGHAQPGTSGM